ncbi:hypothetical protein ACIQTZ_00440 [Paenarthrobacter sp. NPDC090520]|uniref:hypothetical protein n=1 Tax=Paenarthrobacter sp. NPDC090520 TaxID=3364382 RepID=UPI0038072096
MTIFPPVPPYPMLPSQARPDESPIALGVRTFKAAVEWQAERFAELSASRLKRLTDSELAAEFWHASQVATYARGRLDWGLDSYAGISADRAEDIEDVLQRFAELPHFDQDSP